WQDFPRKSADPSAMGNIKSQKSKINPASLGVLAISMVMGGVLIHLSGTWLHDNGSNSASPATNFSLNSPLAVVHTVISWASILLGLIFGLVHRVFLAREA